MKRPEGFDPAPAPQAEAKSRLRGKAKVSPSAVPTSGARARAAAKAEAHPVPPERASRKRVPEQPAREKPAPQQRPAQSRPAASPLARQGATQQKSAKTASANSGDATARQARKAAKERRRFEREEVRRFTRRSRHRRVAWISAIAVVAALVGTVAIAVYSPILALTKIEITGASSVDPAEIHTAVDGQLGTPLALVDLDRLTRELGEFTLIQSYVTETVPPNTLRIHVTERKPVGSLVTASGFTVVDPAGVVIERTDVRPPGIPTIELAGADTDSDVFDSVVEVLLALPASVSEHVDRVTAATKDDVTLVLAGAGQRVVWGSVDQSDLKARVLARLMATQSATARVEYDVTAPLNVVIRPA